MTKCDPATSGPDLLDRLGPLFVINLPERHDRRREFAEQLDKIGLAFDNSQVRLFPAVRPTERSGFPSIGAKGCYLSHLEILRQARDEGLEYLVVCEDDLDFAADFSARLPILLSKLETTKWDILYFGHHGLPRDMDADPSSGLIALSPAQLVSATHFLVFRGSTLDPLIAYLEAILARPPGHPDGGPMHVDGAFCHFRADHPDMVTLAVLPPLGHQRPSRTDIHTLRWFDRFPIIRSAAELLRRLRRLGSQGGRG